MKVNKLCKQIGERILLNDVSFEISNCDKIGLVGENGVGKSTLLRILSGNICQDSGKINYEGKSVAYLKQEFPKEFLNLTILQYVKKECNIDVLESNLKKLEDNLSDSNMNEYDEILNKYLLLDGYSFEYNLESILGGLHFNMPLNVKIGHLSGGEKIKVLLATTILKNADLMLLDEPTNNLDIDAICWLEDYLSKVKKSIVVVSHDEIFLNNTVNKIWELNNGHISQYNVNFELYRIQKENEYQQNKNVYDKLIEQRDKLKKQLQVAKEWSNKGNNKKSFNDNDKIANNYAKERTNSSNISRVSNALQNLQIPDFKEKKNIGIFFDFNNDKGNKDIFIKDLCIGYDKNIICENLNLLIPFGTKINIIGANGSGKTTLIKTIMGVINQISGEIIIGSKVHIGYISQNTLEIDNNESVYTYLISGIENVDKSKLFMLMNKIGLNYDDKDKLYSVLSPGERTRVNIAKLALENVNVLILDEVTNHLDIEALELIYELVKTFPGTIISVSHNRKYNEILNPNMTLDLSNGMVMSRKNLR